MSYTSTDGLKIYWPWEDCTDATDSDRIISCAERSCERYVHATLQPALAAAVTSRITYTTVKDDRAIHLLEIINPDTREPHPWAVCVSRGVIAIRARMITHDEERRFRQDMPNPDDL